MTVMLTKNETEPVHLELEYCDSCSAAMGKYRIWVWSDERSKRLDLVLCGHHLSAHEATLIAAGYEIDEI